MEAIVVMLPPDAGGRANAVSPREGSYRPFARSRAGGPLLRLRFIEGPPSLAPGDSARVVVEIESSTGVLVAGAEFDLLELEPEATGFLTVSRVLPEAHAGA